MGNPLVMAAASLETPFKHLAGLYMFQGLCHQHTVQGLDRSMELSVWAGVAFIVTAVLRVQQTDADLSLIHSHHDLQDLFRFPQ
ncbi:hypothetical protein VNO77_27045 [Canavalia gladiata]|uniref:Uncharacterized protein n=1 Tax=Canavalia gladiata TaxID=3824 RepID=A0AAN9QA56_CANGL